MSVFCQKAWRLPSCLGHSGFWLSSTRHLPHCSNKPASIYYNLTTKHSRQIVGSNFHLLTYLPTYSLSYYLGEWTEPSSVLELLFSRSELSTYIFCLFFSFAKIQSELRRSLFNFLWKNLTLEIIEIWRCELKTNVNGINLLCHVPMLLLSLGDSLS